MQVDRSVVDSKYSVLTRIPLATATEVFRWTTRTFIAADHSESRTALSDWPNISITYNFNLSCSGRTLATGITGDSNRWLIPYFPHNTPTKNGVIATIDGVEYPYNQYFAVFNRQAIVYREMMEIGADASDVVPKTTNALYNAVIADPTAVAVPCHFAYLVPNLSYTDMGSSRDQTTITLQFLLDPAETVAMAYSSSVFDFPSRLQTPVETRINRKQTIFNRRPSGVYSFSPSAYLPTQATTVIGNYLLRYNSRQREEYSFIGKLMRNKGSASVDNYLSDSQTHRLADDYLSIRYTKNNAVATMTLREVAA